MKDKISPDNPTAQSTTAASKYTLRPGLDYLRYAHAPPACLQLTYCGGCMVKSVLFVENQACADAPCAQRRSMKGRVNSLTSIVSLLLIPKFGRKYLNPRSFSNLECLSYSVHITSEVRFN